MASGGFCPACDREVDAWAPGPGGRPGARCPHCQALERHRFLAYLLRILPTLLVEQPRRILDLAPHSQVRGILRNTWPDARYVGSDLYEPDRPIDVFADITHLPFGDGSFDLVICYHVLEHVPDDHAAIANIARVLSASGLALIQVPQRPTAPTDEDPSAPEAERVQRFGQADHVRYYGMDFDDRLGKGGLRVLRATPEELVDRATVDRIGGQSDEPVWFGHLEDPGAPLTPWPPQLPQLDRWRRRVEPIVAPSSLVDRVQRAIMKKRRSSRETER